MKSYLEQYNRMIRWYSKFEEINKGILHTKDTDFLKDEVYSFFQNCFHLKDWIEKDIPKLKRDVENLVKTEVCFKICEDICHGSKHFRLRKYSNFEDQPDFKRQEIKFDIGGAIKINFEIDFKGKNYEAFDIATECVNKWKDFIKNKVEINPPT
jgi:hypothetical protein